MHVAFKGKSNATCSRSVGARRHYITSAVQIVFSIVCALLAVLVYLLDAQTNSVLRLLHVPIATWLVIAASIFPTIRTCGYFVEAVVRCMEFVFSKVENIHYILMGTSRGLR